MKRIPSAGYRDLKDRLRDGRYGATPRGRTRQAVRKTESVNASGKGPICQRFRTGRVQALNSSSEHLKAVRELSRAGMLISVVSHDMLLSAD
jgi:hypothetical protein